jgi:hypothetical protein
MDASGYPCRRAGVAGIEPPPASRPFGLSHGRLRAYAPTALRAPLAQLRGPAAPHVLPPRLRRSGRNFDPPEGLRPSHRADGAGAAAPSPLEAGQQREEVRHHRARWQCWPVDPSGRITIAILMAQCSVSTSLRNDVKTL